MNVIKQYYEKSNCVQHHIDSYNYFISHGIQNIVEDESTIKVVNPLNNKVITLIKLGQVHVEKPKIVDSTRNVQLLYPKEARDRNITYEGGIFCTVKMLNVETKQTTTYEQVSIGKLPVMVRSNICNLNNNNLIENKECSKDKGGYYIIKGKERVLVSQLCRQYNKVYVEFDEKTYTAEMRSMNRHGASVLVQLKYTPSTQEICWSLPYIKTMIPAGLIFKALNVEKKDMVRLFKKYKSNDTLKHSKTGKIYSIIIKQYDDVQSKEEALQEIVHSLNDETRNVAFVETVLKTELFHHIDSRHVESSTHHLGYMIRKMMATVDEKHALDDRHNLSFKRLDTDSALLTFLFRGLLKQFTKTISNQLKNKKIHEPEIILKNINSITNGLHMAFVTGNWNTLKSSTFTRIGVSQVLSNLNYGSKISHLRRIMLPIGNKGKNPKTRQLHSSHFSFICPYETPEGETVGIVTNLALSVNVTCTIPKEEVDVVIKNMKTFLNHVEGNNLILHNGEIMGSCTNGKDFYTEFCLFRHSDMIDSTVSIMWNRDEQEIHIASDEGRLIRPLFKITNNLAPAVENKNWDCLVEEGSIVFRDVGELEHSVVAMDVNDLKKNKCDYMEICPSATMMGVMASVIPFSNHSQSPRNAYQSAMGKQAIGFPCENYLYRFDTTFHVLDSPQKPLTRNEIVPVLHFDEMCHGVNPIVAIMTFLGFNQEDSIILNKSSIDRGLFTTTTYKTIVDEEKKRGNSDFETICLPKFQYRNRNYDYTWLNEKGLVYKKNIWLKKDTVIIGKINNKTVKKLDTRVIETCETSVVIKNGEEGYLDSVLDTTNNDGTRIIKIRIRVPRIPEIGDKFASNTAQKGTCGMIYRQEDLPYDKNGIVPDLIINPHAIPSRMTINMLIEMCFNLVGCKLGKEMDATPFKHTDIEKELQDFSSIAGLGDYMTDLYSGFTGEKYPTKIFMAPCYYQRLKHMVIDKIHTRVTGPLDTLTHQPVAGRARDGGLRFGEMEKDCIFSHGSVRILRESLFDKSDKYHIPVCIECGNIPNKRTYCNKCENDTIQIKNMPYATKLLYQELLSMGIKMKIQ